MIRTTRELLEAKQNLNRLSYNSGKKLFQPEQIFISNLEEFEEIIQGPTKDIVGNVVQKVYNWGQDKAGTYVRIYTEGEFFD